jgi:hypothetical protein
MDLSFSEKKSRIIVLGNDKVMLKSYTPHFHSSFATVGFGEQDALVFRLTRLRLGDELVYQEVKNTV